MKDRLNIFENGSLLASFSRSVNTSPLITDAEQRYKQIHSRDWSLLIVVGEGGDFGSVTIPFA